MSTDSELLDRLISRSDPVDAVAAYYAFWFPGTRIHGCRKPGCGVLLEAEPPVGPVALLRAEDAAAVPVLLERLSSGSRYLMAPWSLASAVRDATSLQAPERNRIFWLPDRSRLRAERVRASIHQRQDRVEVEMDGELVSRCHVLWRSPHYAELAASTEPDYRGRGLARLAVAEMSEYLLAQGVMPLYVADVTNLASLRVAARLGFTPCCRDELAGYVQVPDQGP